MFLPCVFARGCLSAAPQRLWPAAPWTERTAQGRSGTGSASEKKTLMLSEAESEGDVAMAIPLGRPRRPGALTKDHVSIAV